MRHIHILAAATAALLLAGCDSAAEAPKTDAAAEAPKTLAPGEYSYISEVTKLASTDKTTPATKLKMGGKEEGKVCVGADGVPDIAPFVEKGDNCKLNDKYVRSGRISMQMQCSRPGKGNLYPNADGNITVEGFEVLASATSSFSGTGDYALTRHIVAKRTGDCAAAPAQG